MLGIVAPKRNNKTDKYIYVMQYWNPKIPLEKRYFKFTLISDDNLTKTELENLGGNEGNMVIETKSVAKLEPEYICKWIGQGEDQEYSIINIDGNRKAMGEMAMALFKNNGNVPVRITLRRNG